MLYQYDMEEFKSDCWRFNSIAGKSTSLSPADIKKQLDLIQEELNETYAALEALDYTKILDGYCDVLVTTFGLGQQLENLGIRTNLACQDTADNNLSKFIWEGDDVEAALILVTQSLDNLKSQGVESSAWFSSIDSCYVIKDTNNKIRKPVNFKSNDLSQYIPITLKGEKFV